MGKVIGTLKRWQKMKATASLACALVFSILGCSRHEPVTEAAHAPAVTPSLPTNLAVPAHAPPVQITVAASTPADEADRIQPIHIGPLYHTPAASFAQIEKYPWRYVPRGEQEFCNVPLSIGGMICLWGASNAKGGLEFPEELRGIPVGRKFTALYLYHTAFSSSPVGTAIAEMVFRYEDGASATNDIRFGEHVWDWAQRKNDLEDLMDPRSRMVWRGTNWMSKSVPFSRLRFFITEYRNPRPAAAVASIDLFSLKTKSASCVLAMTAGPTNLLREDRTHLDH